MGNGSENNVEIFRKLMLKDWLIHLGINTCSLDNYPNYSKFIMLQTVSENLLGTVIFV